MGKTTRLALVLVLLFIVGTAVLLEERGQEERTEVASSQTPLNVNTDPQDPLAQWGFQPEAAFSQGETNRREDSGSSRTRSEVDEPGTVTPMPTSERAPSRQEREVPRERTSPGGEYQVVSGDTLGRIAQRVYGSQVHWRRILQANRDHLSSPERLRVGMILILPPNEGQGEGETRSRSVAVAPRAEPKRTPAPTQVGGKVYHLIQNNERLWDIARRYYGSGAYWRTIVQLNPGLDPDRMRAGKEILIGERSQLKGGW